jgi:hypothetical protein
VDLQTQGDELAAYDANLRQRGSLTVWFNDEVVAAWQAAPQTTRGGQSWCSPLASPPSGAEPVGTPPAVSALSGFDPKGTPIVTNKPIPKSLVQTFWVWSNCASTRSINKRKGRHHYVWQHDPGRGHRLDFHVSRHQPGLSAVSSRPARRSLNGGRKCS